MPMLICGNKKKQLAVRHAIETAPRLVKVAVKLELPGTLVKTKKGTRRTKGYSTVFEKTLKVNPRKNPDSNRLRTELVAKVVAEAKRHNSALKDPTVSLESYEVVR